MEVLLCWSVAVKLKTDSFPPSVGVDTNGVPMSTFNGLVCQVKITPLSGVAQENSTILPSLTFLETGVTDKIMAASLPT